jgi:hypothetical protein
MRVVKFATRPIQQALDGPNLPKPQNVLARAYMASLEALDLAPNDILARDHVLSALLELTDQANLMSSRHATDWLVSAMVNRYQDGFPRPN